MKTAKIFFTQLFSLVDRNFRNNRFYTYANTGGLAFGLCCAIFILLYIGDEITYDSHHEKHERIYRLESDFAVGSKYSLSAQTSYPFGPVFKEMFPEIESFVRFRQADAMSVRANKNEFFEDGLFYADSTVFDIFTHHFIFGSSEGALSAPYSIVLCQSMSERYFGDEDPCGSIMYFGDGSNCMVTAVIEDIPDNSHLQFDGLISMRTHAKLIGENVFNDLETRQPWAFRLYTYLLLKENTSIASIHKKFPEYYEKHMASLSKYFDGTFRLMSSALEDIHLKSKLEGDLPSGDLQTIYLFAAIGIFILIIASINYVNLATARSAGKAKEIGIRKLCGASRRQLITLLIAESVVITLIALAIALTMADLLIPWFNQISGKSLVLVENITDPVLYLLIAIALILGLLSGIYPAIYLATFKPSNVLYNKIFKVSRKGLSRRILIIFQFSISLALITGTMIIYQQLVHLKSKDLGFNSKNLIVLSSSDTTLKKSFRSFRSELIKISGVENVSSALFITGLGSSMDIMRVEDEGNQSQQLLHLNYITDHFVDLMEMEIVAGRNFDADNPADADCYVLINQTAAIRLGWEDEPLGRKISPSDNKGEPFQVIGVIKDFHYAPLHEEIAPMVYFLKNEAQPEIFIRLGLEAHKASLNKIEMTWKNMYPHLPFTYNYFDQIISKNYRSEEKLLRLVGIFALFSIFIALLGLFSLSSYLTEQYTHVIGIRKVFGASTFAIVMQLSRQYLILLLIACIITIPTSWYLMNSWLSQFAYHISTKPQWFIMSALAVIILAELTVIYQSIKAAQRNPADSLRYE